MDINQRIAAAEKELTIRQIGAKHIKGYFPQRFNADAIERLYDELNHLHIARLEAKDAS